MPDAGLGFCVFNDVAVAIRRLRGRGFAEPVLVVDLDLHDGNGTRRIFADDPTVHTFSIHNDHWGDTEAVASTSIALGPDVGDAPFPRHAARGAAARLRGRAAGARRVPGRHRPRGGRPHRQLAAHRGGAHRARPLRDVAGASRRPPLPDGGRPRRRLRPPRLALQRALPALARLGAGDRARRGGRCSPCGASAAWAATCATRRPSTTGCPSR